MTVTLYDSDDVAIQSKFIDMRLRPEFMLVNRLFSWNVNLPFVVFLINNSQIELIKPRKISAKNSTAFFDAPNLSGSITSQTDRLLIQVQSYGSKLGIMWPNHYCVGYFADEILPLNKSYTTTGKYKDDGENPTFLDLSVPVIHMLSDNDCLTIHSQLQETIEFSFFYHKRRPYWNAITDDVLQLSFRPCRSQREGLSLYYEKCGQPIPKSVNIDQLSFEQMKKCLYANLPITSSECDSKITESAKIQRKLEEAGIRSCFVGSLAMSLHQYPVKVQDFDIVVDDIEAVKNCFSDLVISDSDKWRSCSARLQLTDCHVDFVELSRFDWEQVEEIHGVKVLSKSGLLLMKLIGEYERSKMEPTYDRFKLKNHANLDLLLQDSAFVYPFFDQFLAAHSIQNFLSIHEHMRQASWDSVDLQINEPLVANVFRNDSNTIIPIINNGSATSASVHLFRQIANARWHPIGEDPLDCEIRHSKDLSCIFVPEVKTLGVLVCQDA